MTPKKINSLEWILVSEYWCLKMVKYKAIQVYVHKNKKWLPGITITGLSEEDIDKGIKDGYLGAIRAKGKKVKKYGNR